MKSACLASAALALGVATAFPHLLTSPDGPLAKAALRKRQTGTTNPDSGAPLPLVPPPWDISQYVPNSGPYAWEAPGPGDARGPCAGLNAMANHGYIPRNGIATIDQFVQGTYAVFGMSPDLATFLAIYGALLDGSGDSWSIEGIAHTGIAGSHHNYEADSSPLRSDLNQYGSDESLIMSQFYNLYNRQPNAATANYNLAVLREFRYSRFEESIAKNPYFYYGPFDGVSVSNAAFTFIYRFMSNKSAEHPEGILNKDVLKSFMGIYGTDGPKNTGLTYKKGWERIPDNWYKRNDADLYSIAYLTADEQFFANEYSTLNSAGCNTGTTNSYTSFDSAVLSGGAYTADEVAANPICFGAQFAIANLLNTAGLDATYVAQLQSYTSNLNCPPISAASALTATSILSNACPGFSSYGGPTGPIAPGAIQS